MILISGDHTSAKRCRFCDGLGPFEYHAVRDFDPRSASFQAAVRCPACDNEFETLILVKAVKAADKHGDAR
jgi:hypothetical protein